MLHIAMISGWHVHAKGYAKELNASGLAKVTNVWDELPERGKEWAAELAVPYTEDLNDIWNDASIDGVLICAPTNRHAEIMLAAAQAKKHIFTEKVMTLTTEEGKAVAAAVAENNVTFAISYPHRTEPHNLFAKKTLEEGYLGKPTLVRIRNAHNGSVAGWLPPHFYSREQCGGGAMIDLGAHGMYLSRWLLGEPRSILSMFTNVTDVAVEDNAVSVMEFGNGSIAINETGFVTPASPFSLEIYGTEGSLLIRDGRVRVQSSKVGGGLGGWLEVSSLPQRLDSAIVNWLKAIDGQASVQFGITDALGLTQLMEGAYASHVQGKKILFEH